jgi:hypothetical protein
MQKKNNIKFNDGWCFAIVNGRLAEIHFAKNLGIWAHCYIKRSEFSKKEQKMIDADIKKCVFSYQKGYYYDKIRKIKHKVPDIKKVFPDLKKRGDIIL